jgi:hypothetical protein
MPNVTKEQIQRWLGKRRLAQVKQIWFEGGGFQVVLKDGLVNERYDTNGRFVSTDEPLSEIKADLLELFDDIVAE